MWLSCPHNDDQNQPQQQQHQQQHADTNGDIYELETATEPDITYSEIVADPRATSPNNDAIVYSELQNNGINAHTVAPSGDLYANVSRKA